MLCLCMLMSAMAVGLNVFAQEKSEAVARFEANVEAFDGDVTKAEPSAEDLAAYEKLVAEYKALSNSDKESIDVLVFDVFYHDVVMRERQISIKNHPEISGSKKDHYVNAASQAVTTLGYVPTYIDNAVALAKTIADRKTSVDAKKAAWEATDYNTRVMAGGYGSTHGIISGSVKGDAFKGFKLMGDVIYNNLLKANPAPTKPKSPGLAPKPGSYAEGENDPKYIADFAAWLEKAEAYNKAYAAEYTYKGNLYIEALEWLASAVFNLIDTIASAESPLTEVVKLLPKVAYAVDTGLLDTQIHKLIGKLGMGLGNSINVDLTTEGLYNILAPKLKDIELQAAKTDENGEVTAPAVTLSISLDKDKFASAIKGLSGCGVYTANESIARGKNWFVGIDGDAADAFVVLFRYLHTELTSESNAAAIKTAVKALDMNFAQRIAVNFLVSIVLSSSADGALRTLVFMIPIVKVGVKIAGWFGAFKK